MSTLALFPEQISVLNDKDLNNVHLAGPPGVGKTVMLMLKAVQWINQGHHILVLHASDTSSRYVILSLQTFILDRF